MLLPDLTQLSSYNKYNFLVQHSTHTTSFLLVFAFPLLRTFVLGCVQFSLTPYSFPCALTPGMTTEPASSPISWCMYILTSHTRHKITVLGRSSAGSKGWLLLPTLSHPLTREENRLPVLGSVRLSAAFHVNQTSAESESHQDTSKETA